MLSTKVYTDNLYKNFTLAAKGLKYNKVFLLYLENMLQEGLFYIGLIKTPNGEIEYRLFCKKSILNDRANHHLTYINTNWLPEIIDTIYVFFILEIVTQMLMVEQKKRFAPFVKNID